MKYFSVGLLAATAIGLGHAALAADMKLPVYKAPPPVVAAPPACDSRAVQNGLYFGGSLGWANTDTDRTVTSIISLNIADQLSGGVVSASDTSFFGGVFVGYSGPCMLIGTQPIVFGIEGNFDWLSNNTATVSGTPVLGFGAAPGSDAYFYSDNRIYSVSGLIHFPLSPTFDIFGRIGYAWGNKDVTYNCNGFCTGPAGIAARASAGSLDLSGWLLGIGVQTALQTWFPSAWPMFLRVEYNHIRFGDESIVLGAASAIQISQNIKQDIDILKFGVVVPLSTLGWRY